MKRLQTNPLKALNNKRSSRKLHCRSCMKLRIKLKTQKNKQDKQLRGVNRLRHS